MAVSEKEKNIDAERLQHVFTRNLSLLRASNNMSAQQLSKALNYKNNGKIQHFEKGILVPKIQDLILISEYFDITIDDLICDEITLDIPSKVKKNSL